MDRVALLTLTASLLAGCSPANVGSPSDGGGGGHADTGGPIRDSGAPSEAATDSGVSAAQACADSANARCNRLQTCSPTAILAHYGDVGTCVARFEANCLGAVAAPGNGGNAESYEACAQQAPTWNCSDIVFGKNPPSACKVPAGTLANGAACAFPSQCQTTFCAIVPGAPCGVCAAAPMPGDSCAMLTTCSSDMVCTPASVCNPYADAGSACSPATSCDEGLVCVNDAGLSPANAVGNCQPAATTPDGGCVSSAAGCDFWDGLACNSRLQVCVPVVLGNDGDQCGYVNLQNTGCLDGLCTGINGGMPGTCRRFGAIGGACDLNGGPPCFNPARCIVGADGGTAGTCQIPDATRCQ